MPEWASAAVSLASLILSAALVVANNLRQAARNAEKVDGTLRLAGEAKKIALDAHTRIETANAAASLYREMIAREMVGKVEVREMEARIMAAIDKLGERVDRVYEAARHPPATP
ncbi:hypothetical protein RHODGE_RHODGE_01044 [Rhodoplanes serenus]|uniref:Uncharacterized protein n=1 Tax=Rhodoplanes serenus TaxID=200615 RepID=A0A447CRQ6_9BRAD|nr:hypothetical protein [Rhodoplanes serenus]VCU06563.1 hypothetical protein RHODPL_RHODPL_00011 [Rhodoplanes serenus]VCU07894.1 hypothetical protein RHODGE_RHODGE_01044 [Rhodoplanes serenus]